MNYWCNSDLLHNPIPETILKRLLNFIIIDYYYDYYIMAVMCEMWQDNTTSSVEGEEITGIW